MDSCVGDWIKGGTISRDRINVGLSFNGLGYKGAKCLYGPHATALLAGIDDEDRAKVPYYEIYPQLSGSGFSKG